MEIDVAKAKSKVTWSDVSYALLPVWMLHTEWAGEDYLFAMNGQTGKLIGDLPINTRKVYTRFAIIFIPLAIILAVIIYFVFGFSL